MRSLVTFLIGLVGVLPALAQSGAPPFAAFDKASEATFYDPHDLAIGPDGNLYVADKNGGRIVVLDKQTLEIKEVMFDRQLPGVHDISFSKDGKAAIAVTGMSLVLLFSNLKNAEEEPLAYPASRTEGALLHSNGRLYAMAGGTGTLIAYEGEKVVATADGLFGAHDVDEAPDGSIWVADNFGRRLVKFSPDLTLLQSLDHERFAFAGPRYLAIDDFGRLIVADQDAHRILLIDPDGEDGGTLLGALGDGIPGLGPNKFDDPEGVAVEGSTYYFSDSDNNRIVRYTLVVN